MEVSSSEGALSVLAEKGHMIIYRYNSKNQANPVVRRREFSILTLDQLASIYLPVPPSQLLSSPHIPAEQQTGPKKGMNEYLMAFRNPLLKAVDNLPSSIFLRNLTLGKQKKERKIRKKNSDKVHIFSNAISPQPIFTMYNTMPAKNAIRIASQPGLSRNQKFGKSIENLQKLVLYQDSYRSSLQSQELRRLPPRKRFKIWNTPKYDFRLI